MSELAKCYNCQYRGTVPGDAHSCCRHPELAETTKDPLLQMIGIFASVGRCESPISQNLVKFIMKYHVTGDPHGVRNGWFIFPFNFDPVWLQSCTAFKQKEQL